MTPRQREALSGADIVACEDSRVTGKLFERLGISRPDGKPRFISYHDHNEQARAAELIKLIDAGEHVVLVSDAGTPGLADPGYRVVKAARDAGLRVDVLPGAFAAALAVAGSGLPTDRWVFEGFAPSKASARRDRLQSVRAACATACFYESPRRVDDFLVEVENVFGSSHPVCVARELTKTHEQWLTGTVSEVRGALTETRGEFAIVIGPTVAEAADPDLDRWIQALRDQGLAPGSIKSAISAATGLPKREIYAHMERTKARDG